MYLIVFNVQETAENQSSNLGFSESIIKEQKVKKPAQSNII
jgi:hypothetical protein